MLFNCCWCRRLLSFGLCRNNCLLIVSLGGFRFLRLCLCFAEGRFHRSRIYWWDYLYFLSNTFLLRVACGWRLTFFSHGGPASIAAFAAVIVFRQIFLDSDGKCGAGDAFLVGGVGGHRCRRRGRCRRRRWRRAGISWRSWWETEEVLPEQAADDWLVDLKTRLLLIQWYSLTFVFHRGSLKGTICQFLQY